LMKKASAFPGIKAIVEKTGMRDKAVGSMNVPPKETQ
jgi:hypothetical protein